jgi:adenylate cyclase
MVSAGAIVVFAMAIVMGFRVIAPLASAMTAADDLFYDIYYRLRPFEDRKSGPIVIVAADQTSLDSLAAGKNHFGWPWPREIWGTMSQYISNSGAKAIGFDLIFTENSVYNKTSGDDKIFAREISGLKTPVIFGSLVEANGTFQRFAPPIANPRLSAVNADDRINRSYSPALLGHDAFATAIVKSFTTPRLPTDRPFLLHYFGPYEKRPYTYISAERVLEAQLNPKAAAQHGAITPDTFKGKIVLFGAITVGTNDLKSSPQSALYPGVEIQATAIDDLLLGQQVLPLGAVWLVIVPLLCAIAAAYGVIYPRAAIWKLFFPVVAIIALFSIGIVLFRAEQIRWLPPAESLLVLVLATPAAFAYTYLAEDRQRRFMLKALSKIVSPAIADQLSKNPERLQLGTVRTELTVLFTDLANFTGLSESMDVQQLGELLNRYLGDMSDQVLLNNGTLDKYIGDAVMCFWNAPLPQEKHAMLACRAALAMARKEQQIKADLGDIGKNLFTRIGINTTSAAVGFAGSSHLFNYTALGDGVNLASRLEGANKLYGTQMIVSESTALAVRSEFVLRKLDLLQVKGKSKPIAVYELVAETGSTAIETGHIPLYESALSAYQKQDWDTAERLLLEVATRFGDDKPSQVLLKRIAAFRLDPPPVDWDGTHEAKDK